MQVPTQPVIEMLPPLRRDEIAALVSKPDPHKSLELGQARKLGLLDWIFRHGFTVAPLASRLMWSEHNIHTQLRNWVDQGLIVEVEMYTALTRKIYILGLDGLVHLTAHADLSPVHAILDSSKISWRKIVHSLAVQNAVLKHIEIGASGYATERELSAYSAGQNTKRPDAAILLNDRRIALEVELTSKPRRQLQRALRSVYSSLKRGEYDEYIYLVTSTGQKNRIEETLADGLPKFKKVDGRWMRLSEPPLHIANEYRDRIVVQVSNFLREFIK